MTKINQAICNVNAVGFTAVMCLCLFAGLWGWAVASLLCVVIAAHQVMRHAKHQG